MVGRRGLVFGAAMMAMTAASALVFRSPAAAVQARPAAVASVVEAVVVRSWREGEGAVVLWDHLNEHWSNYGTTPIHIDYSRMELAGEPITYQALADSGADVAIISDPAGGHIQYSADEIAAIGRYVREGHNLIGSYLVFSWLPTDNRGLAPFFGLDASATYTVTELASGAFRPVEPDHPLFASLPPTYTSQGFLWSQVPEDGSWDPEDLGGAEMLAVTDDRRGAILGFEMPAYSAIYFSHMPEYLGGVQDAQVLYNAIVYQRATLCRGVSWRQSNASGFGNPDHWMVASLGAHLGRLYAGTVREGGPQIWRLDPEGWVKELELNTLAPTTRGVANLLSYAGGLYAATWDETVGGRMWRTPGAAGPGWEAASAAGFGDLANVEIPALAEHDGYLYAGTCRWGSLGGQLWRSASGSLADWQKAGADGLGSQDNACIRALAVMGDFLYAGTYNAVSGAELWRSADGSAWEEVVAGGLGDSQDWSFSALQVYDGWLYASTIGSQNTGARVLRCQTCDGTDWQEVVSGDLGGAGSRGTNCLAVWDGRLWAALANDDSGMQVWSTPDGSNWRTAAPAGFGDLGNEAPYFLDSMAAWQGSLFIGTQNTVDGGEIWESVCLDHAAYLPLTVR